MGTLHTIFVRDPQLVAAPPSCTNTGKYQTLHKQWIYYIPKEKHCSGGGGGVLRALKVILMENECEALVVIEMSNSVGCVSKVDFLLLK
ncbi:hypothetical protein J6590_070882 [Homalodisca vitripennis]|nr:hypothetical protein J6590_070882 [Homalodisca vitripennis]